MTIPIEEFVGENEQTNIEDMQMDHLMNISEEEDSENEMNELPLMLPTTSFGNIELNFVQMTTKIQTIGYL